MRRNEGVTPGQDPDTGPSVIPTGGSIRRSNMTHRIRERALPALLVSGSLVLASMQVGCASQAAQADTPPAAGAASPSSSQAAQTTWSSDELNQLVAPKLWKQIGGSNRTPA